ncbi:putative RNA polymerase Rpb5 domain superfamily [Helianthus annuus]|nr:putative RNA polymerase Rpb5 domain superfamily [Helianthus annuus]
MKSENVFRPVLVVRENLTPFARTCMSKIATKFHLEVFQLRIVMVSMQAYAPYECPALTKGLSHLCGLRR